MTIDRLEHGYRPRTRALVLAIAAALNVTPDALTSAGLEITTASNGAMYVVPTNPSTKGIP